MTVAAAKAAVEAQSKKPAPPPPRRKKVSARPTLRNRIVGLQYVDVDDLDPHPLNWRQHPSSQQDAMTEMLQKVGIANAVIAFTNSKGRLQLIDGHLRRELYSATAGKVPTLVLDVTEDEAKQLLLTLDPLSALADSAYNDLQTLKAELPADIFKDFPNTAAMLDSLLMNAAILNQGDTELDSAFAPDDFLDAAAIAEDPDKYVQCPTCEQKVKRTLMAQVLKRRERRAASR